MKKILEDKVQSLREEIDEKDKKIHRCTIVIILLIGFILLTWIYRESAKESRINALEKCGEFECPGNTTGYPTE
ncbi:MAG: hypothetical protein WDK96_00095 [Candidatus Paceibacterota bacterium]|jgi:hypothetical protein